MQKDKILHLIAGLVIAVIVGLGFTPVIGLIMAIVAGAGKELIHDKYLDRGYVDFCDFTATCTGGAIGMLVISAF